MTTRVGAYKPNGLDHWSGLRVGMMSLDCTKQSTLIEYRESIYIFFPLGCLTCTTVLLVYYNHNIPKVVRR